MAKKTNSKKVSLNSAPIFTLSDFSIRPVTQNDTWCRPAHLKLSKDYILIPYRCDPQAPLGYLVTIPHFTDGLKINLHGYVIKKNMIKNKTLYLQIFPDKKRYQIYEISSQSVEIHKKIKKKAKKKSDKIQFVTKLCYARVITIRNINKHLPQMEPEARSYYKL